MAYHYIFKRSPLTADEQNRLINACTTLRDKLVIWVLLDTGLRIEELTTLTMSNIDWQGSRMTVWGKGSKEHGKKRRVVPLTHRAKILLETYYAATEQKEGIGVSIRVAQMTVKRIANKAGISRQCCPHVLRHTFAVTSLERGVPLPALQKVLGHEDLQTTAIYLNLSNEEAVRVYHDRGYK